MSMSMSMSMNRRPTPDTQPWLGGAHLLRGITVAYLGIMVALPLAAVTARALSLGGAAFWAAISDPEALAAIRLTLGAALAVGAIDAVIGTLTAWALVRYRFPGQSLLNALVDIPFALPTVVTGLMLVGLYGPQAAVGSFLERHGVAVLFARPGILLALLFVTFPFVVRSVQPVLMELERDAEEAARTLGASTAQTFRRVVLPVLLPAILSGAAMSFSRALGEFGSVVLLAGNIPYRTQLASVYIFGRIESDDPVAATAVSVVMLLCSLSTLFLLEGLAVRRRRQLDAR
jgi:sulfate/thiosulfate transport system permease protein